MSDKCYCEYCTRFRTESHPARFEDWRRKEIGRDYRARRRGEPVLNDQIGAALEAARKLEDEGYREGARAKFAEFHRLSEQRVEP